MAISCDVNVLAQQAKCFKCNSPATLAEIQTYLLCQILNNGTGGGGGLPTGPQAANTFLAGPTSGAASPPTFRLMVTADLGTTLTPQFAQVGIGTAPIASVALAVNATTLAPGITTPAFNVIHPGLAGNDVNCYQIDSTAGDPYMTIGQVAVNNGCLFQYQRSTNLFRVGIHGGAGLVTVNSAGSLSAGGSITAQVGNIIANLGNINCSNGIFVCQANNGISQTFDTGAGNTQIQFVGGIAVAIA